MSIFVLEKKNLEEAAFMFPIMGNEFYRIRWADILVFGTFTLWVLLFFSAAVAVLLGYGSGRLLASSVSNILHGTSMGYAIGFGTFSVFLVGVVAKILQNSIRMLVYLAKGRRVS